MIKKCLNSLVYLIAKQYTSIGGQAVIEGVMMRSPNAFVVAVRMPDGKIKLRRDQWFGLGKRFVFFRKPFFRGVLMLIEAMVNGIVSLNYSANVAMAEEIKAEAEKKGKNGEEELAKLKEKEKIDWKTGLAVMTSLAFGLGLFVFLPHALTALIGKVFSIEMTLDSFMFHFIDGLIKAIVFLLYVYLIGFIPDIRRVFQYHGAEHKSISTFEAEQDLVVENAKKFTTLHPRCGTSFIFFLIFLSIFLFTGIFGGLNIGTFTNSFKALESNMILGIAQADIYRHICAIFFKIALMLPIAGISYEIIRFAGKNANKGWCKAISIPGMMLQKLTTKEPDDSQLEVALASIKAVLFLEKKYDLGKADKKLLQMEEIEISQLADIEDAGGKLKEFLE